MKKKPKESHCFNFRGRTNKMYTLSIVARYACEPRTYREPKITPIVALATENKLLYICLYMQSTVLGLNSHEASCQTFAGFIYETHFNRGLPNRHQMKTEVTPIENLYRSFF